jgi:glycosyltransferase involved in cell wall biosynthesis
MVDRLGDEFDFRIVTLNHDSGSHAPYPGIEIDQWTEVGKAKVMYLAPADLALRRIEGIVRNTSPDVIYLNSFFDPIFTQRVLWARRLRRIGKTPIVIAPRGEFAERALQLKGAKKMAYLYVAGLAGLYHGLTWQASSAQEQADILRSLAFVRSTDIREAMDLAPADDGAGVGTNIRRAGHPLRICILARICPMKNLDFAIRALAAANAEVEFTIYGPVEVREYWATCQVLIAALPPNVKVIYAGEVHPSEVKECLAKHDLFFFPTRGENYGHAIHEALSAGLPVLISNQTPWCEVAERGVGWVLPLDSEVPFARRIDEFSTVSAGSIAAMKKNAANYARERATKPEFVQANRELFIEAVRNSGLRA